MKVYIYTELDKIAQDFYQDYKTCLSKERQEKINAYYFERDKKLSLMAYILLLYAYEQAKGVRIHCPSFTYGKHGKPYFQEKMKVNFNLSHCKEAVVCGISIENALGVDVQDYTYQEEILQAVYSKEEMDSIERALTPEKMAMKYWAMKESYLKFTGEGLNNHLDQLDCAKLIRGYNPYYQGYFHLYEGNGYMVSAFGKSPRCSFIHISYLRIRRYLEDLKREPLKYLKKEIL